MGWGQCGFSWPAGPTCPVIPALSAVANPSLSSASFPLLPPGTYRRPGSSPGSVTLASSVLAWASVCPSEQGTQPSRAVEEGGEVRACFCAELSTPYPQRDHPHVQLFPEEPGVGEAVPAR